MLDANINPANLKRHQESDACKKRAEKRKAEESNKRMAKKFFHAKPPQPAPAGAAAATCGQEHLPGEGEEW